MKPGRKLTGFCGGCRMSKIQWTQQTWNPIIGCSKISEGCANCYAERTAARLARIEKTAYYGEVVRDGKWNGSTDIVCTAVDKPYDRRKPTVYFVCSMSDLFHESIKDEWRAKIFRVMAINQHHRFIVLTKRPERMREFMLMCQQGAKEKRLPFPWKNIILGVTAENQEQADKRIPVLLDTPAAARFVSIEPMLGAVDLTAINANGEIWNTLDTEWDERVFKNGPALDWVICGGESGPGARPMHPDWARGLRDQCADAGVPFFFKQWGESVDDLNRNARANAKGAFWMLPDGTTGKVQPEPKDCVWMNRVGKNKAGNVLDGQVYEQFPAILREVQNG